MTDALILFSFIAGLIPAVILLVLYGLRTAWSATVAGRAVFALVVVIAVSYGLSVITLTFPQFFREGDGEWVRIVVRLALAGVLWNLLSLFLRAQGIGKRRKNQVPDKEQDEL